MSKAPLKPWAPADYEVADAAAIQALMRGDATEEQQQRALRYVIEVVAGTYEQTYWPGGDEGRRDSDFAEGRRFVGNTLVKLTKLNLSKMRRMENG